MFIYINLVFYAGIIIILALNGFVFIHFLVRPCISYLESTFLVVALNIQRQTGKVCFLSYGVMWSFSIAIVADGS